MPTAAPHRMLHRSETEVLFIDLQMRSAYIDIIKGMRRRLCTSIGCTVVIEKVRKGVWGMPRLLEATKDVESCDKPRGFANKI